MAIFFCEEIRPLRNLNAYLSRKGDLAFSYGKLLRSTGKHLLTFSIRTPDGFSNKYRFNFLGYKSEFIYVGMAFTGEFNTANNVSFEYLDNQDLIKYGDNSVSGLISRMILSNSYDSSLILDKFSYRGKNYSFGWDSIIHDIPVLGEYWQKKEYIGINLHIDETGNFSIEPSEFNKVLRSHNDREVIYLDCTMRKDFKEPPFKEFYTGFSPYSIDRYSILYDALISVFDIEPIKTGE